MLQEFWATTESGGVYHVFIEDDSPVAEKAFQFGEASKKAPVGTRLNHGSCLAITLERGLVMYHPQYSGGKRCTAWETNTAYWGGHTSPIVGLFMSREQAVASFSMSPALTQGDSPYISQTLEVLNRIPDNHPVFVLDEPVREVVDRFNKAVALCP